MSAGASNILGVSPLPYDSSAALLRDGVVIAAIENDKLARMRSSGMPDAAIAFCLQEGRISSAEVDCLAIANRPGTSWLRRVVNRIGVARELSNSSGGLRGAAGDSFSELSPVHGGRPRRTLQVDHHLCHAASAFFNLLTIARWLSSWMRVETAAPAFWRSEKETNSASCSSLPFLIPQPGSICRRRLFWASCPAVKSTKLNG